MLDGIQNMLGGMLGDTASNIAEYVFGLACFWLKINIAMFVANVFGTFSSKHLGKHKAVLFTWYLFVFCGCVFAYGTYWQRFTMKENYFQKLNITRVMSTTEIKKVYRRYAAANHPDKFGGADSKRREFQYMAGIYQV